MAGVVWALRERRPPRPGRDDVDHERRRDGLGPVVVGGAGVRGARRDHDATGLHIDRLEQARIAQRAENDYVGAPTGLLDQLASLFGEPRRRC